MYCSHCGKELPENSKFCPNCGAPAETEAPKVCPECGEETIEGAAFCAKCGRRLSELPPINLNKNVQKLSHRSKLVAGLLGIFLGGFGVHNFYIGKTGVGVAQIILTIATCGIASIWGFIEGIVILTQSEPKDADGNIMKD